MGRRDERTGMDRRKNGLTKGWMNGVINGQRDEWTEGWTNGGINGRRDQWTEG